MICLQICWSQNVTFQPNVDEYYVNIAYRFGSCRIIEEQCNLYIDPNLIGYSNSRSEIMRCIFIRLLWVQNDLNERPTATLIAYIFCTKFSIMMEPNKPATLWIIGT